MKKITTIIAASAIIMLPAFTFASVATPSSDDQGNAAVSSVIISTPDTTDEGNAGSTGDSSSNTPTTDDSGNAGSSSTGGSSFVPETDDQGNAAVTPTVKKRSSGGGSYVKPNINTVAKTCPYITEYMTIDGQNNSAEVTKLQAFLNLYENAGLTVTGIFDTATLNAVKAFQTKYFAETMLPWGTDKATGNVYITTLKKINEIYCSQSLSLTDAELAIIASYRASLLNPQNNNQNTPAGNIVGSITPVTPVGNIVASNNNGNSNENVSNNNSQTASASGSKAGQFFRGIIRFLFNR